MKKRKYAEGGVTGDDLEAAHASEDPIGTLNKRKGWTDTEEAAPAVEPKKQSFKEAFAEARKGGGKTFEWNGKKYTTDLAKPSRKVSTRPELGPEMGEKMTAEDSAKAMKTFGYPKGSERLNSLENPDATSETFKRGGKVSSASKRADGIAQRGKTRGTMVMCGGGYMKGKK